jgi:hypothetical protein
MNANLQRRLSALRAVVGGGSPIVLHLPDGSTRNIVGTMRHYRKLCALMDGETESPLDSELDWLRSAIKIDEQGRHVFELLAAILRGPNTEDETEVTP